MYGRDPNTVYGALATGYPERPYRAPTCSRGPKRRFPRDAPADRPQPSVSAKPGAQHRQSAPIGGHFPGGFRGPGDRRRATPAASGRRHVAPLLQSPPRLGRDPAPGRVVLPAARCGRSAHDGGGALLHADAAVIHVPVALRSTMAFRMEIVCYPCHVPQRINTVPTPNNRIARDYWRRLDETGRSSVRFLRPGGGHPPANPSPSGRIALGAARASVSIRSAMRCAGSRSCSRVQSAA